MNRLQRVCVGLLLGAVWAAALMTRAGEPAVASPQLASAVALIPGAGPDAPRELAFVQLEAALSTNQAFALVEREQVHRVLAEQQLTPAGLAQAEQATRLAPLLSADLFVFVERVPQDTNQTWRIQLVESRTGLALGHFVQTGPALARNPAPLASAILSALAKARVPLEQRHFVGVLGFRSEEIGHSLDPLASLLEAWLPFDLAAAPNIVLLDRKHLDRLTTEQNLSGLDLRLKSSTLLVRGTLKRAPEASQVLVRLAIQSPEQPALPLPALTLPINDLPALRRALASALFDHLHVAKPAAAVLAPAREAALFKERAPMLFLDGDYDGAAQAAEAACALEPTLENRLNAARFQNEAGIRCRNSVDKPNIDRDQRSQPRVSPEAHLQILRHAVRAAELYRGAVEASVAETRSQPGTLRSFPRPRGSGFTVYALQLPAPPEQTEAMALRHELQQHSVALFRLERDYYAGLWNAPTNGMKFYEHPQFRWSYVLVNSVSLLEEWTDDPTEWTRLLGEVISHYQHPPGPFTIHSQWGGRPANSSFWHLVSVSLPVKKFASAEDYQVLTRFMEPFTRKPPSELQLAALSALSYGAWLHTGSRSVATPVLTFLDRFVRDYPPDHPVRRESKDFSFPSLPVTSAVNNLHEPKLEEFYGRAILKPLLAAQDGVRLCSWRWLLTHWLEALERNGNASEALACAHQARSLLTADLPEPAGKVAGYLRPALAQICARLGPLQPQSAGPWAGWQLTQLSSDPPSRTELLAVQFLPQRLLELWLGEEDANHALLRLTTQPLAGGPRRILGEATVRALGKNMFGRRAVVLAADDTMACVGTGAGGLVVFGDREVKQFTETNGLPGSEVRAVGCFNGEIYLGFKGGLASLNPLTGRFTEFGSTRSTEHRSPFDGQVFVVLAFLPDPARQCLWLSVSSWNDGVPGPLHGLWKYIPQSQTFEKLPTTPYALGRLSFQHGHIVGGADWPSGAPVAAIDLQSGQLLWLLAGSRDGKLQPSLFGQPADKDVCWLWRGDELLTGGPVLSRRTRSERLPATLSQTPDGRNLGGLVGFYEPDPGRILFATAQGELWQLRPPVTQTHASK